MRCKGTLAAVLVLALVLFSSAPVTCLASCGMSVMGACSGVAEHHSASASSSSFSHEQQAAGMVMAGHSCAPGHGGSNSSEHAQVVARQAAQRNVVGTMNAGCDRSVLCPDYLQGGTSAQATPPVAQAQPSVSPAAVVLARIWSSRPGRDVRGHRSRLPVQSVAALRSVLLRV